MMAKSPYDAHRLISLRARAREALIMGRVRLTRTRILELSSGWREP
jgi:hypothetical protein